MITEPPPGPSPAPLDPALADRLHRFAHDIRNRLAGMQQVMQHLSDEGAGMDRTELVTFGEQQFFKALRQVEDLLDDLGVDRTPLPGTVTDVHLAPVVRTAINGLQHRFGRKDQHVESDLDEGIHVPGNADHLDRMVSALLSNASKFSPAGSPIHVRLRRDGDHAVLTVQDEGVGLTAADLDQVFVRYAWLQSRPTDGEAQGRSTLARIRDMARAHGGELTAASAGPGHGSTFTLRLPTA
jgi:signal transduction histidine kinase